MKEILDIWDLSQSKRKREGYAKTVKTKVPSNVLSVWGRANGIGSIYENNNESRYAGLEDLYWRYSTSVEIDGGWDRVFLVLESVEYSFTLYINGKQILRHEGMYTPVRADISRFASQKADIEIVIDPAPKVKDVEPQRGTGKECSNSCMPAFQYGWDWAPRYIALGIVGQVYIEYRNAPFISDHSESYRLNEDMTEAIVRFDYRLEGSGELTVSVADPEGRTVSEIKKQTSGSGSLKLSMKAPRLWYPRGYGEQNVYTIKWVLKSDGEIHDSGKKNLAFRRVRMVHNGLTHQNGSVMEIPCTIELNGVRVFAKGSNFVPPRLSFEEIGEDVTERLLDLAEGANFNILRIWGGGFVMPDSFYDSCDRRGIMIWQEFPLSCANYRGTEAYLRTLRQEAGSIVRRLRTHGCLVLWCGGNELWCKWSDRMTYSSPALRTLDQLTFKLDPDTPFWQTSPLPGIKHGGYYMRYHSTGREILEDFVESSHLAFTEFGSGCVSEYEVLEKILNKEELTAPEQYGIWESRHGKMWAGFEDVRALTGIGEDSTLKETADSANELQGECYKALFEAVRHKQPRTSMAINWDFNEPWATLAGNELISFPYRPRPSYYKVRDALRSVMLSLGFSRLRWSPKEKMTLTPWILNDSDALLPPSKAILRAKAGDTTVFEKTLEFSQVQPRSNAALDPLEINAPECPDRKLKLEITSTTNEDLNSEYTLFVF